MNRIKEVRKKKGLSLQQVADAVGVGNNTISRYETGKREPKLETWQALANFFNVTVPYLQGIEDKSNTGYSKDYIYKQLDDAYKEDYPLTFELEPPFTNTFISARDEIENYCKQNKISIPKDTDLDFWKTNFNFIFNDKSVKRLLTTKDSYSDDDIKEIIINAIYWYGLNPHIRELVNKLNHKS
ncbi:helix-turn-helix transcriptional regulator [Lactobacillus kefiranofaciens subsp. kefirgranum]|uniref:helix-turn-helix domain-containing protein n=1 Tax=Lactobacillus kefiranofaciens TaxID=267818 RepID=UPI0006F12AD1|nr:helix-turn-helix transcriptional regulator [Lactobacillus kefiranofaciens]KRL28991.1 hypothetical protein FC94_GL000352 [Lactobacillus kefiranofaciens subsp. kefirgranum DSM 10550 = JCM 8572]